jgi:hypothetical protein
MIYDFEVMGDFRWGGTIPEDLVRSIGIPRPHPWSQSSSRTQPWRLDSQPEGGAASDSMSFAWGGRRTQGEPMEGRARCERWS